MDIQQNQVSTLLDAVREVMESSKRESCEKVRKLLSSKIIRDGIAERKVRQRLTAERFNVFDALWLERREIYHSRFIAYLLDPGSSHDQGTVFLDSFLTLLGSKCNALQAAGLHNSIKYHAPRVIPESGADEHGRIDIVIYLRDAIIAIENKVGAEEGDNQIPRYRNWLDKQIREQHKYLVFLTHDGRFPVGGKDKVNFCLSYADIAEWLGLAIDHIPKTATPLLETINQYRQLCLRIAHPEGHEMTQFNQDTLKLLQQPNNLEIALEISTHLEHLKAEIKNNFKNNVVKILENKLNEKNLSDHWIASTKELRNVFGIRTHRDTSDATMNYQCGVQKLFVGGWFGWQRPFIRIPKGTLFDTKNITADMKSNRYRGAEDWWVGWKPLNHEFNNFNTDTILAINDDNSSQHHPLAKQLAEEIWNLFIIYHAEIEALESFKSMGRTP